jgi:hypothetical protein
MSSAAASMTTTPRTCHESRGGEGGGRS